MLKSNVATLQSTPPETAFPALPPLDIAAIAARAGDASAKLLGDIAGGEFTRPDPTPHRDYKAETRRDAATAVLRFLDENGETRFIRDDRRTKIDGVVAGFRFEIDGRTCWLISPDAWREIVGGRQSDYEAALIDSGVLYITETVSYHPSPTAVIAHTTRSPVSTKSILGLERRGFIVDQDALDQIPIQPTNPENDAHRAIGQVGRFLSRQAARFRQIDADAAETPPTPQLAGWRSGSGDTAEFWVLPHVWKWEACVGIDPVKSARILSDAGLLIRGSDGLQGLKKIAGAPRRVYCVRASIFAGVGNAV